MQQIPAAKEFKAAINSMSPEQQRFMNAYRSMQLNSTLFGICVIQIKPQLEKLLRLPNDGLTKEIKLTQRILNLLMEYQIPSDMLSYQDEGNDSDSDDSTSDDSTQSDEDDDEALRRKLKYVKAQAEAMHNMIEESKKEEVKEAELQLELNTIEAFDGYYNAVPETQGYLMDFDDFDGAEIMRTMAVESSGYGGGLERDMLYEEEEMEISMAMSAPMMEEAKSAPMMEEAGEIMLEEAAGGEPEPSPPEEANDLPDEQEVPEGEEVT